MLLNVAFQPTPAIAAAGDITQVIELGQRLVKLVRLGLQGVVLGRFSRWPRRVLQPADFHEDGPKLLGRTELPGRDMRQPAAVLAAQRHAEHVPRSLSPAAYRNGTSSHFSGSTVQE